jgi:hypothetical protein
MNLREVNCCKVEGNSENNIFIKHFDVTYTL